MMFPELINCQKIKKWIEPWILVLFFFNIQLISAQTVKMGDVNSNGVIDIVDAMLTAQYCAGLNPSNFNLGAANVNADEGVTIIDALLIAQFSSGLIHQFPAEVAGIKTPWDWAGVIGTGQSLAVGEQGNPVKALSQPYNNLKLSTGNLSWPVDPNNNSLKMVLLVEPVGRLAPNYPSSWPANIAGETPHTVMGNEITALVRENFNSDYISVHGNVGENGQCMIYLKKNATQSGINGRAYEATLVETKAITRLAKAAGKTYGVGAVIITHGECDSGNTNYENELYRLWSDYNIDLKAITGQTLNVQMFVSQQNSQGDNSSATLAQWKVGVNNADIVCSGPKYQYPYATDNVHLSTDGYEQLGEKYGQIYYERVVCGRNWQPLQPIKVSREGRIIAVQFQVPVPPLVWDNTFQAPLQNINEWKAGKGFEVRTANNGRMTINSVTISGDTVRIACAADIPASYVTVAYAMSSSGSAMSAPIRGTLRWGQLRDSDPFTGSTTKKAQPNYCVAFELPVP